MLYVSLMQRIVERCTDPTSPNYNKVTKMNSLPIEGFLSYNLDIVPRKGEIICLENGKSYQVVEVVHTRRCCAGLWHPEVIVEVVPHVAEHIYDTGSYSFKEEWPLISDLTPETKQR